MQSYRLISRVSRRNSGDAYVKKHLSNTVQPSNDDGHMDTDGQLDIDWVEDENTDEEL